jgi:FtsP/CotA-like multicopper oxidase with cupredoxin domain
MVGDLMVGAMGDHAAKVVNTDRMLAEENDSMDKTMKDPTDAYVAQLTKGEPRAWATRPLNADGPADGTKQFTLTASIIDWQVDPDTTVQAWAYNGMVPGPWIKVDPGDKVQLVLKNHLPQSTVIHLHGIEVPNAMDGVPMSRSRR